MTRTLVTGAAGFTGRYVTHALTESGTRFMAWSTMHEPRSAVDVAHVYERRSCRSGLIEKIVAEFDPIM